ncbi:VOC family protein [uncultured Aquimarina sp.]|uniref:VOC family protein n=1 Tax=uncultured Aquimarina sp. TaxID=575652 RepID=UPI002612D113|nr:VOC family protein [uncultured Aquimarina sp.]
MEIKSLKILSKNIEAQKVFYRNILGFSYELESTGFKVKTQENTLSFEKSEKEHYYHFAFLIPTSSIEYAIDFLEKLNIKLLLYKGEKIIEFDNGRAIYFYDKDENIVEFIERPLVNYPVSNSFSIDQVIKLNEIGLPDITPIKMANTLINKFGINPINKNMLSETFCWVGDHNGVIIVTKEGRNWLPTNKPGIVNDFTICYQENGIEYHISFVNNNIKTIK